MSMIDQDFVRDIIERHSDALGGNGRDFHNGAYVAIANELNSTLSSCNCSNSERTNEPCLPHFWTHDGTLHIEATRMPTRIVVCEGGTCEFVPKRELDASEAENAKLRELVRDAWGDGHPDRSCEGCDIRDECHDDVERIRKDGVLRFSRCLFELRIEDRMRELGIEVDA